MRTIFPRRFAGVSGAEFNHSVAPAREGIEPSGTSRTADLLDCALAQPVRPRWAATIAIIEDSKKRRRFGPILVGICGSVGNSLGLIIQNLCYLSWRAEHVVHQRLLMADFSIKSGHSDTCDHTINVRENLWDKGIDLVVSPRSGCESG